MMDEDDSDDEQEVEDDPIDAGFVASTNPLGWSADMIDEDDSLFPMITASMSVHIWNEKVNNVTSNLKTSVWIQWD